MSPDAIVILYLGAAVVVAVIILGGLIVAWQQWQRAERARAREFLRRYELHNRPVRR